MSESSYYECCGSFGTHTAECNRRVRSAALSSPETPRDLLDECVPRVLELLRAAGITEPDELKHRLDDHERWRKELAAVSPQEDAAPPADLKALIENFIAKAERYRIHSELTGCESINITLDMVVARDALRSAICQPPSLLAVPEGRLRELIEKWRDRIATCQRISADVASDPALSRRWAEEAEDVESCADDLDALLASVSHDLKTKN